MKKSWLKVETLQKKYVEKIFLNKTKQKFIKNEKEINWEEVSKLARYKKAAKIDEKEVEIVSEIDDHPQDLPGSDKKDIDSLESTEKILDKIITPSIAQDDERKIRIDPGLSKD